MKTAIVYITQRCNLSCVFCLEDDPTWRGYADPETDDVRATIDRLYDEGARHITFMGGETLFRKDLSSILEHARARGFTRLGVTTNGSALSKPGAIARLRDAGLQFIELSIPAHTADLSRQITRSDVAFERQARAIEEIVAVGCPVIANVVICRENRSAIHEIVDYVTRSLPLDRLRVKLKFVSQQGNEALRTLEDGQALAYSDVDLIALGDALVAAGAAFWTSNAPLCRLGPHAAHAHEVMTFATGETYFDLDHVGQLDYFDSSYQMGARAWPEPCAGCSVRPVCPGVERAYLEQHGTGELRPRTDDPAALLAEAARLVGAPADGMRDRVTELAAVRHTYPDDPGRRPGTFRLEHPESPVPMDLSVTETDEDTRGYLVTDSLTLGYVAWRDAHPREFAPCRDLLEAAAAVVRRADADGVPAQQAVLSVIGAAKRLGWQATGELIPPIPSQRPKPRRVARASA